MMAKWHEKRDARGRVWHVLALCDPEILGKVLRQGDAVLDLDKHRDFYQGERLTQEQAEAWLKTARNINVVGEKSVACATRALNIDPNAVRKIQGVPHVQIYYV